MRRALFWCVSGAVVGLVGLAVLAWVLLGRPKPPHAGTITLHDSVGVLQLVFASVAGAGALVALVVGYRRQKVAEATSELDRNRAELDRTRVLNERFATAAAQLGDDKPAAVRLAGVHAMAGLADDWEENRQTCISVLCAYLRMPYARDPGEGASGEEQLTFRAAREVRHTAIRVIAGHLRDDAKESWAGRDFDFTGVVFDGGDFSNVMFSGFGKTSFRSAEFCGTVTFGGATFSGGRIDFRGAAFSGGTVDFGWATFSGGRLDFSGATFSGGTVGFGGAFSGSTVDFNGAAFSGGTVDFGAATFSSGAVSFRGGEFSAGKVSFSYAKFSGCQVDFSTATFSGCEVDFSLAEFSAGKVSFGYEIDPELWEKDGSVAATTFSGGTLDFDTAKFCGSQVDFHDAEFSGSALYFGGAEFSGGEVDFRGAAFSAGSLDFSAADWSKKPLFDSDELPPAVVLLPRPQKGRRRGRRDLRQTDLDGHTSGDQ